MAEDFDDPRIRWGVGNCPNPECSQSGAPDDVNPTQVDPGPALLAAPDNDALHGEAQPGLKTIPAGYNGDAPNLPLWELTNSDAFRLALDAEMNALVAEVSRPNRWFGDGRPG